MNSGQTRIPNWVAGTEAPSLRHLIGRPRYSGHWEMDGLAGLGQDPLAQPTSGDIRPTTWLAPLSDLLTDEADPLTLARVGGAEC